jgi:hypothetical protein
VRRPPTGELSDLERDIIADVLAHARAGDTEALASFLERSGSAFITDEVLRVIIDTLRGRVRRPRGRLRLLGTIERERMIATTAFLLERCGMATTTANKQAAKRHGSNLRSVERARARHRQFRTAAAKFGSGTMDAIWLRNKFRLRDDEIRRLIDIWRRDT